MQFTALGSLSKAEDAAYSAIKKELQSEIIETTEPYSVYSYHTTEEFIFASPKPTRTEFEAYLKEKLAEFWDPSADANNNMLASGYYAATDPYVSRSFGGDDFVLAKTRLRKGTRVLRADWEWKDPKVLAKLAAAGCAEDGVMSAPFQVLLGNENSVCRKLGLQLLQDLDVDAVAYPWFGAEIAGCASQKLALLVLKPELFDLSQTLLLTRAIDRSNPTALHEQNAIQQLWRDRKVQSDGQPFKLPWPKLKANSSVDTAAWLKTNIQGCP